ncbi:MULTISPECIES: TIGR01777 family oxidoreductase [Staphylococcus]|uniref:TIGR01777 family oxidoreductase n=1 Tax=Staphylococcus TaxID=1279 RepID=UPI000CD1AEFC|nr:MULTISPECIES: TIGR01777 family oxidoreductase [Staphylococcus]MBY7665651.1 TIGR01777 family oxidoreductase [Staphylococcus agnetis]MCO4327347.1 TIGR01777 family oxidoreductase [Staphylococcus agnetis]MCO4358255.1 TIGR01777 family oxidoreductase [Staphylococcus agnetis]MCO4363046.1 TIGR01777 family oxidoreductase [Staphylococcus agnetis]MCO4369149.1 TIGR01777 family oxidoreductase [Staphylococcus agnetis]
MTNILISGGTGLVGRHLVDELLKATDNIIYILTRSARTSEHPRVTYINWQKVQWEDQVPDIDIVINLAGASLNKRWTDAHKQLMMTSRIQATHALFELFENRTHQPNILFNASAMGYYPPSKKDAYTENYKTLPHDFLSEIVYQWEREADHFSTLGTRVIKGRFGLILSDQGGALPMMALPYQYGVGGKVGDGKQWYSWIHLNDLVQSILFLIKHPDAQGVYNLNAPLPETQNDFGIALGRALHRPHYTRVPGFMLRVMLGEMSTLILDTQYMVPERIQMLGFKFEYPELNSALQAIYQN